MHFLQIRHRLTLQNNGQYIYILIFLMAKHGPNFIYVEEELCTQISWAES